MMEVTTDFTQQQVRTFRFEVHHIHAFLLGGRMGLARYAHVQYSTATPGVDQTCS